MEQRLDDCAFQGIDSLSRARIGRDARNTEQGFDCRQLGRVVLSFVDHVDREHHRHPELRYLQRQIQISNELSGVDDHDGEGRGGMGTVPNNGINGDLFLNGASTQ
jgi:hypothetical protein